MEEITLDDVGYEVRRRFDAEAHHIGFELPSALTPDEVHYCRVALTTWYPAASILNHVLLEYSAGAPHFPFDQVLGHTFMGINRACEEAGLSSEAAQTMSMKAAIVAIQLRELGQESQAAFYDFVPDRPHVEPFIGIVRTNRSFVDRVVARAFDEVMRGRIPVLPEE